jgi:hypothetical protein
MNFKALTRNEKIYIAALLGVAMAVIAFFLITAHAPAPQANETFPAAVSLPSKRLALIEELQKYLPTQVDQATTLERVSPEGEDIIAFDYIIQSEFYNMPGVIESMDETLPETMESRFCGAEAQEFRSLKIQALYRYKDETGKFLNQYLYDTNECPG